MKNIPKVIASTHMALQAHLYMTLHAFTLMQTANLLLEPDAVRLRTGDIMDGGERAGPQPMEPFLQPLARRADLKFIPCVYPHTVVWPPPGCERTATNAPCCLRTHSAQDLCCWLMLENIWGFADRLWMQR